MTPPTGESLHSTGGCLGARPRTEIRFSGPIPKMVHAI